jgi:carbonic anhydrase/acetyltransferase-like protein (isoleucine patch superfamily)
MNYRPLTDLEVSTLKLQGCTANDWSDVAVKENFRTEFVKHTAFYGKVKLGCFGDKTEIGDGPVRRSGLYNTQVHQCEIGDEVLVSDTGLLSNYIIDDHVIILNTDSISVKGESAFGNGTEIEVLNEAGGRELVIFDRLSAQLAYLLVFYRHDPELTRRLKSLIQTAVSPERKAQGRIGAYTKIQHAGVLQNVVIGSHAVISGPQLMEDCSVISNRFAPVRIGEGVIIRKSVILSGSAITDNAFVEKCFVGQGVTIGRQFSAENSAFFANTEVALGEACSIFAGPYTVSHHKSTLLVAGMFSFYNAGSGTNISNHMYKLGPLHQGIVERGSKTGSSSYLLWPCRVGAYSVVVGKHFTNFDTCDFPFSYIVEEKGKSILYPAMNLFTVGTRRDSEKWPARDKRTDPVKHDLISFDWINPYIAGKISNGVRLLGGFTDKVLKTQEHVSFKGIQIPRLLLKTTRKFYELALKVYIGSEVVGKLESETAALSAGRIKMILAAKEGPGRGEWRDLSGMIAPAEAIDQLTMDIKKGDCGTVEQVLDRLQEIHRHYKEYSWNWCSAYFEAETGLKPDQFTRENLLQIVAEWQINAIRLNQMILQDASKEFDLTSHYGYGIDGDEGINALDFETVRGNYEENKFIKNLRAENENIGKRATRLVTLLQTMK